MMRPLRILVKQLITKTISEDSALFEIVSPTFENWDSDPDCSIRHDSTENGWFVDFCTLKQIPAEVTLNEYVDLAKLCNTPSKEFINGVLDRIANDLLTQGKMVKSGKAYLVINFWNDF